MKINPKILSIPPYISTSWKNIASLHVEHKHGTSLLIITLLSGAKIEVPQLSSGVIDAIFKAHAFFLEQEEKNLTPKISAVSGPQSNGALFSFELPFKGGLSELENMGTLLQHNPEQSDHPDLPKEILEKIAQLSQSMGIDDPEAMPKPEPHCNCIRCQIAKAMQGDIQKETEEAEKAEVEEVVSDEDLKFCTWDVQHAGHKLYTVTNRLDDKECYQVHLGQPLGCTCGQTHCEHIRAALNT